MVVRAIRPNNKLCGVQFFTVNEDWCQSPAETSLILPGESTYGHVPRNIDKVPVILFLRAIDYRVNLVAPNDARDNYKGQYHFINVWVVTTCILNTVADCVSPLPVVWVELLAIVVGGVLLREDIEVIEVCLGLEDVVTVTEVNGVALPVVRVEYVTIVDD